MMHSRAKMKPKLLHVVAIAATAMFVSPAVLGQVWSTNTARQNINKGAPIVAKRIASADTANYCAVASMPGTHFTWVDTSRRDWTTPMRGRCGRPTVRMRWRRCVAPK